MEPVYSALSHYFNDFSSIDLDPTIQNLIKVKTLSSTFLPKDLLEPLLSTCLADEIWHKLPQNGVLCPLFDQLKTPSRSLAELQRKVFQLLLLDLLLRTGIREKNIHESYVIACQHRDKEIALYLAIVLLTHGKDPLYQKTYEELAKVPHLKLPMIYLSLWMKELPYPFEFKKKTSVPNTLYLKTLQALEEAPLLTPCEKLSLIHPLYTCAKQLNFLYILLKTGFFSMGWPSSFQLTQLKEAVTVQVLEKLLDFTPAHLEDAYWSLSEKERYPGSLALLFANIRSVDNPLLNQAIREFFLSLVERTFLQKRYNIEGHPHLEFLSKHYPLIWNRWVNFKGKLMTDEWQDLLLSGTEVEGSCQKLEGLPQVNQCLMNTLLDGKIKLIALKNSKGNLVARALIKLLLTEEKTPALFLEKEYPPFAPLSAKKAIREEAISLSLDLEIPLYTLDDTPPLSSISSRGPEYEDGLAAQGEGVTSGIYTIGIGNRNY
ncbi:MAG: hypothetical protein KBC64_02850 [Simkaniaceae bacterium]|nr:hypothetical protein [Simkaniaceae bacterium]